MAWRISKRLSITLYLLKKEPGRPSCRGRTRPCKSRSPQRGARTHVIRPVAKVHTLSLRSPGTQAQPALLHALITVESGYNPNARSPKGAIGLMQLMPETARRYRVTDIWDPDENLRAGARYLRDLLVMFDQNLSLALAAYNAGEAAVVQYGNKIPPSRDAS